MQTHTQNTSVVCLLRPRVIKTDGETQSPVQSDQKQKEGVVLSEGLIKQLQHPQNFISPLSLSLSVFVSAHRKLSLCVTQKQQTQNHRGTFLISASVQTTSAAADRFIVDESSHAHHGNLCLMKLKNAEHCKNSNLQLYLFFLWSQISHSA